MAKAEIALYALNRGIISKLALARQDLKRTALSAQIQDNWMPRRVGSMMLRPGWQFLLSTKNNATAKHIPFVKQTTDTAIIQLTDSVMRVLVNEAAITRVSVGTTITNGTFSGNITGWTSADETGATSSWIAGNFMQLVGTAFNSAVRKQTVTVAGGDQNKEHALRIVIARGLVKLRVGSADEGDDYVQETELGVGTHSLAFTPTGNFFIKLFAAYQYSSLVQSVAVEGAGTLELPTPWTAAMINTNGLSTIRWSQSADIVFVACDGLQQRKIERRGTRSWSIVLYQTTDGPFRIQNFTPILLTPSGTTGDITLTASENLFYSTHVGALFSLTSVGQDVTAAIAGANQFSNPIQVTGTTTNTTAVFNPGTPDSRTFTIKITGTFSGKVTLQRSISAPGNWVDVPSGSWTAAVTSTFRDGLANTIAFYRLGIETGNYTSGTANVELIFNGGSATGTVRITAVASKTSASAQVVDSLNGNTALQSPALGNTASTSNWAEGYWSDFRGWPTSVALYEGRLWWFGRDASLGSVSDAYASYDATIEGDSGPIIRTIGEGPVDVINWGLPVQRLILGAQGSEISARSSTFDEPLTPTTFNLKDLSNRGSAAVAATKVDTGGFFVGRTFTKIFKLTWNFSFSSIDYTSADVTRLVPELGLVGAGMTTDGQPVGFCGLAVQREPDTRIHAWRADGTTAVLVFDEAEEVECWVTTSTQGTVEDAFTLPGPIEDKVYYLVNRTINGSTVRYLERWAREDQCQGGNLNLIADSFITYSGAPASTITAAHLKAATVVVWGDGKDLGTAVANASTGVVTLPGGVTASNIVVGLPYTAKFQSAKLAYADQSGSGLTRRKTIPRIGVVLDQAHTQGLLYGPDFSNLDNLPLVEEGADVDPTAQRTSYDEDMFAFAGDWTTDARVCLQAAAPRNVTVLACLIDLETAG